MSDLINEYHLLDALWMTIKLTILSALGATIIGTVIAILRLSPVGVLRWLGTSYVTLFRNTPLTVVVFMCQAGLYSALGIYFANSSDPKFTDTNSFRIALLGLSLYHASFICEAIRSGINTIPLGQAEAARSIGLTFSQSLREVILPQAFRGAVVPIGNTFIALAKNTTVVVTIGVIETAGFLKAIQESAPDQLNLAFFAVAAFFVLTMIPLGLGMGALAKKVAVKR